MHDPTASENASPAAAPAERPAIACRNPWTGELMESVPANVRADAAAVVARARHAQAHWATLPVAARAEALLAFRDRLAAAADEIVALLVRENGKPPVEAWFAEIVPDLELVTYWAKSAKRLLRPERVRLDPTKYPGKKAIVHAVPKGVVAVISAWNYPVALSLRAIVPALMAGNAVVYKPASEAVLVGRRLVELFAEVLPKDVLVPFYGPGALGSAILEARVDHLAFIGSVDVGRQVAALCGQHFTSCSLELGGKDAAIVCADADLHRAVEGVVWGAFTNGGQNCASIERLLVEEAIADRFLPALVARTQALRPCTAGPAAADVGPLRNAAQVAAVQAQVDDAVRHGAQVLCGGAPIGPGFGFAPTILDHVQPSMAVWQDETFGPLLPVIRVRDVGEAVALANQNRYGLTNSLWTSDYTRARYLALTLKSGVVTVNNHAFSAAIPSLPWGGIGWTGTGSTNGPHGFREFVRPQLVLTDRTAGHEAWWYPYDALNLGLGKALAGFLSGKGGLLKVLGGMRKAARRRPNPQP